jgi:acyl-CoA synthetase (AMP-forming)/AMP-acid ligase II
MLERHDDIVQACVVPVPDEIKGAKPIAFVVLRPNAHLTEDEVRRYASDSAPATASARRLLYGGTAACPTNKVDRKALAAGCPRTLVAIRAAEWFRDAP